MGRCKKKKKMFPLEKNQNSLVFFWDQVRKGWEREPLWARKKPVEDQACRLDKNFDKTGNYGRHNLELFSKGGGEKEGMVEGGATSGQGGALNKGKTQRGGRGTRAALRKGGEGGL